MEEFDTVWWFWSHAKNLLTYHCMSVDHLYGVGFLRGIMLDMLGRVILNSCMWLRKHGTIIPVKKKSSQNDQVNGGYVFSFVWSCGSYCASMMAQMLKNPPAMQETRFWSLGQEDPLEKGMATHFSILAWSQYALPATFPKCI